MNAPTLIQASRGCGELEFKHVLLVDDNQLLASRIRSTLKFLVKSHEFVVTTVATGADAIRAIMAFDFDIIICDMMMPHMAGDMFYLAVQRVKPQMIPSLLFVTDPDQLEIIAYLRSINAQMVFKPIGAQQLECAISAVLARRKRASKNIDFDLDHWKEVPCLTDRVAVEDDVRAGRAVFYIRPLEDINVGFVDIGLPHCAIFTDECEQRFPVVVVQSEFAGESHYVGFHFLKRGNGIGFRSELELLDEPNELFESSSDVTLRARKTEPGDGALQHMPPEPDVDISYIRTPTQADMEDARARARAKQLLRWESRYYA